MIGRSLLPRFVTLATVALCTTTSLVAAADTKWSGDTAYKNRNPSIAWGSAAAANVGFVVWENDRLGLLGRPLDADGNPTGSIVTLKANDPLPSVPGEGDVRLNKEPAVIADRAGRLFVVWTEELVHIKTDIFYEDRQVLGRDVYAQVFDAAGASVGAAFRVHADARGFQGRPGVARLARFRNADVAVVAWESDGSGGGREGVFARAFQIAPQSALTGELDVAVGSAKRPAVAGGASTVLFAWENAGTPIGNQDNRGLFARALDGETLALGKVSRVSNVASTTPSQASLAVTPGGFLAAWTNAVTATKTRVLVRPLAADGVPSGPQRPVSSEAARAESAPTVASRGERVAVLWLYWGRSLVEGVLAVEVDKKGNPGGVEEWLNEQLPSGSPYRPTVTITPSGSIVGAWQGPDSSGQWSIRSGKLDR
jgi:hypothetical protein